MERWEVRKEKRKREEDWARLREPEKNVQGDMQVPPCAINPAESALRVVLVPVVGEITLAIFFLQLVGL